MYFSRVASLFLAAFVTFGVVALANPVEKRQESAITTPLNSIVVELQSVLKSVNAGTVVTVIPQITALISQVDTKISVLNGNSLKKRALVTDVAVLVDGIISDVVKLLDFTVIPVVDEVVIDLDKALNGLVVTVDKLIPGVLVAVTKLVSGLGGLLDTLGLQLVLATLGL